MGLPPWYRWEFDHLVGTEYSDSLLVTLKLTSEIKYLYVVSDPSNELLADVKIPTRNYEPRRVTFHIDENGIIKRISCG